MAGQLARRVASRPPRGPRATSVLIGEAVLPGILVMVLFGAIKTGLELRGGRQPRDRGRF